MAVPYAVDSDKTLHWILGWGNQACWAVSIKEKSLLKESLDRKESLNRKLNTPNSSLLKQTFTGGTSQKQAQKKKIPEINIQSYLHFKQTNIHVKLSFPPLFCLETKEAELFARYFTK